MAGMLHDGVLDGGLDYLATNGDRLDICDTAEPTTYSLATVDGTNSLGNAVCSIGAAEPGTGSGRMVTVAAITDGTVTETGTAGYFAITDGTSELLVTGVLSTPQEVTDTNTFTLTEFEIEIPDPA
jgi:hypothetical protein